MKEIEESVRRRLFEMQDAQYQIFSAKLMPNLDPSVVIGVRSPALRAFAKDFAREPECEEFLRCLPHKYYEENNLHGFVIEKIKDYDALIEQLELFLPYIDNWATCDCISPKVFKKHLPELLERIKLWLRSGKPYTIRFGINMLMGWFLDESFSPEVLELVAPIRSDEYYVNMMIAWFFATALAKQPEATMPYIEQHRLDSWTHNKTIQKAVESYRISDEAKAYLRSLKDKQPRK